MTEIERRASSTVVSQVQLDNLGVEFPIYQASARLLRKTLLQTAVGGFLGKAPESGRVLLHALQGVTLNIGSGERVALLGHNGAGKTTLLRTIAGIYHPTAGTIAVEGRCMPLFDIGLGLDAEATGYENILIRGLLMGLKRSEIEARVGDIADFSELGDFLDLPIRTYSSGMTLRLLFSIATSTEVEILLMDEWIGAGDQDFISKADLRLRKLVDSAHILIFASHNQIMVEKLCTRGIVLMGGRVVFDGPVGEAVAYYSGQK